MVNKYLEKIAGLGMTLRRGVHEFGEHLSGKALEKAKMEHAVNHGSGIASEIEHHMHNEMVHQYHGNPNKLLMETKRHDHIMHGQNQINNHILNSLKQGGHLNPPHIGTNIERLTLNRNIARGVATGAGGIALGGAVRVGHSMNKESGLNSFVKNFGEHLSGRALEKARILKSINTGMHNSLQVEMKTHKDLSDMYSKAKDLNRLTDQFKTHTQIMNGMESANHSVLRQLELDGHFKGPHAKSTIPELKRKRDGARATVGGVGGIVLGSVYEEGRKAKK